MANLVYDGKKVYVASGANISLADLNQTEMDFGVISDAFYFCENGSGSLDRISYGSEKYHKTAPENLGLIVLIQIGPLESTSLKLKGLENLTDFVNDPHANGKFVDIGSFLRATKIKTFTQKKDNLVGVSFP